MLGALFAAGLIAGGAVVPATALAAPKSCAGIGKQKIMSLKAENVSCAKARKVAKGWKRTGRSRGFGCGYYPVTNSKQIERVRCEKGDAVVTFRKRWIGTIPFPTYPPIQTPSVG